MRVTPRVSTFEANSRWPFGAHGLDCSVSTIQRVSAVPSEVSMVVRPSTVARTARL